MHGPTHQERLSSVVFLALFFFSPFLADLQSWWMLDRSNVLQFLFTIHLKKTDHLKFTELQPFWSVMPLVEFL